MKLQKLTKLLALALVCAAPAVMAQSTAVLSPFMKGDGNSYGLDLYYAYALKTKGDFTIMPELRGRVAKVDGDDSANFDHSYFRLTITDPRMVELGSDWKIGWSYRYIVPTTKADQLAGSYGRVGFRPWITKDFGHLNFTLRSISYLHFQRNAYSENIDADEGGVSTGNKLATQVVEIMPQVDFMETESGSFYVLPYVAFIFDYVMAPPGGKKTWSNGLNIVPEVGYTFKKLAGGAQVAVYYDETGLFGTDKVFKLFNKDQFEVGLSWTQPF